MSIVLKNQIRELAERVEKLERAVNVLSPTPRTVAGVSDPAAKPVPKKVKSKSKSE